MKIEKREKQEEEEVPKHRTWEKQHKTLYAIQKLATGKKEGTEREAKAKQVRANTDWNVLQRIRIPISKNAKAATGEVTIGKPWPPAWRVVQGSVCNRCAWRDGSMSGQAFHARAPPLLIQGKESRERQSTLYHSFYHSLNCLHFLGSSFPLLSRSWCPSVCLLSSRLSSFHVTSLFPSSPVQAPQPIANLPSESWLVSCDRLSLPPTSRSLLFSSLRARFLSFPFVLTCARSTPNCEFSIGIRAVFVWTDWQPERTSTHACRRAR